MAGDRAVAALQPAALSRVMPEFEFDPIKDWKNWWKHGAGLSDAARVWDDPQKQITRGKTKDGESRFYAYGRFKNQIWKAVFTLRAGRLRVIAFYPAPRRERDAYYRGGI
jgi:uncharacterized protein